jgi:hypothetical protein
LERSTFARCRRVGWPSGWEQVTPNKDVLLRVILKTAVETLAAVGHYPAHVMCNQLPIFAQPRSFNEGAALQKANARDQ